MKIITVITLPQFSTACPNITFRSIISAFKISAILNVALKSTVYGKCATSDAD